MKQFSIKNLAIAKTLKITFNTTVAAAFLSVASLASRVSLPSVSSTTAFVSMGAGLIVADNAFAATNKPVAGVGIKICKRPGGSSARTKATTSDANGNFKFTGLAPGDYDVTVGNGAVKLFVVGADGALSGTAVQDISPAPRAVQSIDAMLPVAEINKNATIPATDPLSMERIVRKDNSKGHKPIEGVPSTY